MNSKELLFGKEMDKEEVIFSKDYSNIYKDYKFVKSSLK